MFDSSRWHQNRRKLCRSYARVAELADAPDSGSGGKPCGFKSCLAHHAQVAEPVDAAASKAATVGVRISPWAPDTPLEPDRESTGVTYRHDRVRFTEGAPIPGGPTDKALAPARAVGSAWSSPPGEFRVLSSVGERRLDMAEARGSIPRGRTKHASQSERRGPRPISEWHRVRLPGLAPTQGESHDDETGAAHRRDKSQDEPVAQWVERSPFKSGDAGSMPAGFATMKIFKSPPIHRTPLYRARSAFRDMMRRCRNANGKNPTYANIELRMTLDEWLAWSVPKYETFIAEHPHESPNAARVGDAGHYEIGNIEIIPHLLNRASQSMPRVARPDGMKTCSRCEKDKPVSQFSKRAGNFDGLNYWCRECMAGAYRNRRTVSTMGRAQAS